MLEGQERGDNFFRRARNLQREGKLEDAVFV